MRKWYGCNIEMITHKEFKSIQEVWRKYMSLNVATGAICSTVLKREVRVEFQKLNGFSYQAFGFDISETGRALAMKLNYPDSRPIFPLLIEVLSKKACINMVLKANIQVPVAYELGLNNNNCLQTGCVQGGIGYWQWMRYNKPDVFDKMADEEHLLTNMKGQPVTMLKDQSKKGGLVFLKPHPLYPKIKDISMMKGRKPEPLMDCNGFCGLNDFKKKSKTLAEINYAAN